MASSMEDGIAATLKQLGLAHPDKAATIERDIETELHKIGVGARLASLRYGKLTLVADVVDAQVLRFEKDKLLSALQKKHPEEVSTIVVRVERKR